MSIVEEFFYYMKKNRKNKVLPGLCCPERELFSKCSYIFVDLYGIFADNSRNLGSKII